MRLVAQVEAVGAVPAEIRHREGPHRDGEGFERRWRALASRLAREDAGDVLVERHGPHRVSTVRAGDADAKRRLSCSLRRRTEVLRYENTPVAQDFSLAPRYYCTGVTGRAGVAGGDGAELESE